MECGERGVLHEEGAEIGAVHACVVLFIVTCDRFLICLLLTSGAPCSVAPWGCQEGTSRNRAPGTSERRSAEAWSRESCLYFKRALYVSGKQWMRGVLIAKWRLEGWCVEDNNAI